MTSVERLNSLIDAVSYITGNRIEGDFVECGTWKGGSVMCMQKKIKESNNFVKGKAAEKILLNISQTIYSNIHDEN